MGKVIKKNVNHDDYQATIERLKKLVVEINYSKTIPGKTTQINKTDFWKKAREVGKNPISDGTTSSRALSSAS